MNKSDSIAGLAKAMAKAQATLEGASKDRTNPHFKAAYATLSSVVDAVKSATANTGLSYTQVIHDKESAACVETIIMHESGEFLCCGPMSVPVSKHDAQGFGSALTYARRYSLSAAFGVAPEDDDGNAAAKTAPEKKNGTLRPATFQQWNALSDGDKERLKTSRSIVENSLKVGADIDAWEEFSTHRQNHDDAEAIWSCLDSAQRTRMTKAKEYLANAEKEDGASEATGN